MHAFLQPDGRWWLNNTGVLAGRGGDTVVWLSRQRVLLAGDLLMSGMTPLPARTAGKRRGRPAGAHPAERIHRRTERGAVASFLESLRDRPTGTRKPILFPDGFAEEHREATPEPKSPTPQEQNPKNPDPDTTLGGLRGAESASIHYGAWVIRSQEPSEGGRFVLVCARVRQAVAVTISADRGRVSLPRSTAGSRTSRMTIRPASIANARSRGRLPHGWGWSSAPSMCSLTRTGPRGSGTGSVRGGIACWTWCGGARSGM